MVADLCRTAMAESSGTNMQKQVDIMKNTYKSFALLCMGLAAVACVEEQFEDDKPKYDTTPGNEIVFSAKATVESGTPLTKTVYGDVTAGRKDDNKGDLGTIEILWKHGDPIQIASPHTAGTTSAKYLVNLGENATENTTAAEAVALDRQGGVGLQWTDRTEPYSFYAMYPSPDTFGDDENTLVIVDKETETVTMKGHLPVDTQYDAVPAINSGKYMISPDMRYAYMVANDTYDKGNLNDDISLNFNSLATALQFELQAGEIRVDANSNASSEIIISTITLFSAKGSKLAGDFTYRFGETPECSVGTSSTVSVTFNNVNEGKQKGLTLESNQYCDITFFILPSYVYEVDDLKLKVAYYYNGALQTKTATIGTDIKATRKHYFKGVKLPDINKVTASSWFDALDPETPVAKLSMPVAGNAYSYDYNGNNSTYSKQQVLSPTDLWNLGVRGFELKSSYPDDMNLGSTKLVYAGQDLSNKTFDDAFKELYGLLQANPSETLVIIATYQTYSSDNTKGVNAQNFITALETYLSTAIDKDGVAIPKSAFAKLSTKSVVDDIKGKVVVIIRPGDDDMYRKYGYTTSYDVSTDWYDYISLIPNWGTGVDQWDKRFGSTYYTEGDFTYDNSGKTKFESIYLKGSTQQLSDVSASWPTTRYPYWSASVNRDTNQSAFINCWDRIVPESKSWETTGTYGLIFSSSSSLYYYWPESFTEKVAAVTNTVKVSRNSIEEGGKSGLYINSLSGYFITDDKEESVTPYVTKEEIEYTNIFGSNSREYTLTFVTGGDYASVAANLNYLLWDELESPEKPEEAYGPLGLVVLDYIGADATDFTGFTTKVTGLTTTEASNASKALPGLILMNNFKVKPSGGDEEDGDLTRTSTVSVSDYDTVYLNGGDAISFE